MTDTTATPTDSEREQALKLRVDLIEAETPEAADEAENNIAQALADQRATIHAQYAAVAQQLVDSGTRMPNGRGAPYIAAAERIRKVAQQ